MKPKHRVTINLKQEEYQALQTIAARTDRSLAWLGRKAICDLLENEREKREAPAHGSTAITSNLRHDA